MLPPKTLLGGHRFPQQITLTVQTGNDFFIWGKKDEANATVIASNPAAYARGIS